MTNTFSGIHPDNIYAFIASQLLGAIAAVAFSVGFLVPPGTQGGREPESQSRLTFLL